MSDKKHLKAVDLDDLQPADPGDADLKERRRDDEEVVDAGVSLKDLDSRKKSAPAKTPGVRARSGEVVAKEDFGDLKSKNGSINKFDHISAKYRFDRRELNPGPLAAVVGVFLIGLFARNYPWIFGIIGRDDLVPELREFLLWLPLADLFAKYSFFICAGLAAILPLKRDSTSMYEIFYEGVSVPSEVFPLGRPARRRLLWKEIVRIEFLRKKDVPFVRLFGKDSRPLGEMRLDVDNLKGMYRVLDRYAPKDHILRKLINN